MIFYQFCVLKILQLVGIPISLVEGLSIESFGGRAFTTRPADQLRSYGSGGGQR